MHKAHTCQPTGWISRRVILSLIGSALLFSGPAMKADAEQFKILHIMSYDSSWGWNQDQLNGFAKALEGVDVEYKVFEMDTKRNSSQEWFRKVSREAKALIDGWKPDLVYTNDDNAQAYVTRDYVNADIPFVFSAVNASPETYGFVGSTNVTGVLEHEHFVQSVKLLKQVVPTVRKIAVIVDEDPMWDPIIERMQAKQDRVPEVEFVSWHVIKTFEEYQHTVIELQTEVDALALIGIFLFKDAEGNNVSYRDVLQWTTEHSQLPDFSFWKDRVDYGTLCTVTVSGYEQGLAAGHLARQILVDGKSPSDFPMAPTVKGEPVVSLARARKLGIQVKTDILLTAEIITHFIWEQQ